MWIINLHNSQNALHNFNPNPNPNLS